MKTVGAAVVGLLAFLLLIFALQGLGFISLKFWGPKYEDARREIFENTKSYKQGNIRDLQNLMIEYRGADSDGHRKALKDVILHRFAAVDRQDLTPELRRFLSEIESE